jgi:hypothetical protein
LAPRATGLTAAGVPSRPSKLARKAHAPKTWRHAWHGLWRRHQPQPAVENLSPRKWLLAPQLRREFCKAHPQHKLPVPFDTWYTQPALCRVLDNPLKVPYVGTLARDTLVMLQQEQQR